MIRTEPTGNRDKLLHRTLNVTCSTNNAWMELTKKWLEILLPKTANTTIAFETK
jgi:uncharacterized HAD superfamily protein